MELGARSALLLALEHGPGFGLELIERVSSRSLGAIRLNRGGAYLALRALEREGLLRGWKRRPGGAGRPRRYYELTADGIERAHRIREALASLVRVETAAVRPDQARQMGERVMRASALSLSSLRLREAATRAGLR